MRTIEDAMQTTAVGVTRDEVCAWAKALANACGAEEALPFGSAFTVGIGNDADIILLMPDLSADALTDMGFVLETRMEYGPDFLCLRKGLLNAVVTNDPARFKVYAAATGVLMLVQGGRGYASPVGARDFRVLVHGLARNEARAIEHAAAIAKREYGHTLLSFEAHR